MKLIFPSHMCNGNLLKKSCAGVNTRIENLVLFHSANFENMEIFRPNIKKLWSEGFNSPYIQAQGLVESRFSEFNKCI